MATPSVGETSKRELIEAAIDALGQINDESTRWATKRALVRLAREVRDSYRSEQSVSRQELRERLQTIADTARRLRRALGGPGATQALFHAYAARDMDLDSPETYAALESLPDALERLPDFLGALETSAITAVEKLGLRGQRGNVKPFAPYRPSAKARLAACGMRLFQVVRGLQQRPNPKNQALHHFLTLMWEAATGERDVFDWTAPLQTARSKRFPKGAEVALIYARVAAGDLIQDAARWERGHRKAKNQGMVPPSVAKS